MTQNEFEQISEGIADVRLADACPTCAGKIHIRLVGRQGTTWCSSCQHLGHVLLEPSHTGEIRLTMKVTASA